MNYLARRLRDNHIGLLNGHVTVNAFVLNLCAHFFGHAAALTLMAGQALQ
jgi:hypothetical protein